MPDVDFFVWVAALVSVGLVALASVASYVLRIVRSPLGKLAMSLFSLSQALVVLFVTWSSWRLEMGWGYAVFVSLCGAFCALIDPLVFRGLAIAEERAAMEALEAELEEQIASQERHLEQAMAASGEAKRLRSSLSSLFAEMGDAVGRHDARRVRELLGRAVVLVPAVGPSFCPNPAIDALLATKVEQCRSQQTRVDVRVVVPARLGIPVVEVCAVLSNLLDNAMAAVRLLPVEDRRVEVTMRGTGGGLALVVRNRFDSGLADERRPGSARLVSRGSSALPEHGWGLSIVELIAGRHAGTFSTSAQDGWFEARVFITG